MARTKRKVNPLQPETSVSAASAAPAYRAAGYIRLSIEDGNRPGSETLNGQKQMVRSYIETDPTLTLSGLFCDNGYTGTDFERPAFDQLMDAVRRGEVNCIVVKDLSRFGRNYKETGNYLERLFPFLGVRFIAINDNFDTLTAERNGDGYTAVLLNMVNELYSKDLSAKLSAAFHTKQKNGAYIGAAPPYGYRKCAGNINKLEPDPETAPIVRRIFQQKASGIPALQIARTLNAEGIIAPGRLHCMRTGIQNPRLMHSIWEYQRIYNMLRDPVYLGHMAQGRSLQSFHEGIPKKRQKRSNWVIVQHTHEPLVDPETFQLAQARRRAGQKHPDPNPENLLRGLIFCADCGFAMYRNKTVSKTGRVYHAYLCRLHKDEPERCSGKYINEKELLPVILDAVKKQVELAANLETLVQELNQSAQYRRKNSRFEKEYARISAERDRQQRLCGSLYQNYVEGLLSEQEYWDLKGRYQAEIQKSEESLQCLDRERGAARELTPENRFLTAFRQFPDPKELTREMAEALIQRIEIGENQQVSIIFRYRDEYRALTDAIGGGRRA